MSEDENLLFVIMNNRCQKVTDEVVDQLINQYVMMEQNIFKRYDRINHILELVNGMLENNKNLEGLVGLDGQLESG